MNTSFPKIGNSIFERGIFLDSSALISLYDNHNNQKENLRNIFNILILNKEPLITTILVVSETQKRLLFDISYEASCNFLNDIFDGSVNLIESLNTYAPDAKRIIEKLDDQKLSFTDAISMAIMKEKRIYRVLTNDYHFSLLGFEIISY